MKCPTCHKNGLDHQHFTCRCCGDSIGSEECDDPAELLRLIEKIFARMPWTSAIYEQGIEDGLGGVKTYLFGDHEPLERLAGE